MPTITNPGVISALVTAYLVNDCNEAQAGLAVGYSSKYIYNGEYSKLFNRPDVIAEIRAQRLELIKKTGFTKEDAHAQLDEDRAFARQKGQAGAAHSSTSSKIRLYGMDQVAPSDATIIVISPPTASPPRVVSSKQLDGDTHAPDAQRSLAAEVPNGSDAEVIPTAGQFDGLDGRTGAAAQPNRPDGTQPGGDA